MNYAGSFDKDEVIQLLITKKGFRIQGSTKDGDRTILEHHADQVGNNCLTYMETVDGLITRSKIFNKMVQMQESKSVRETVGQHWKDWVCQKDTRLANARDLAKDRGLTQAEVTFYCKDRVPSDNLMEDTLLRITEYVSPTLVLYSTQFSVISNGGIYSWYEGGNEDNLQQLEKAGLVAQGNKNCKVDMHLLRVDILEVKLPVNCKATQYPRERTKRTVERGSRRRSEGGTKIPFEDVIAEKRNRLWLLDNYNSAFSDKIIHSKELPLGSYNVMTM